MESSSFIIFAFASGISHKLSPFACLLPDSLWFPDHCFHARIANFPFFGDNDNTPCVSVCVLWEMVWHTFHNAICLFPHSCRNNNFVFIFIFRFLSPYVCVFFEVLFFVNWTELPPESSTTPSRAYFIFHHTHQKLSQSLRLVIRMMNINTHFLSLSPVAVSTLTSGITEL